MKVSGPLRKVEGLEGLIKNLGLKLTTDMKYKETSLAVYMDFKKGRFFAFAFKATVGTWKIWSQKLPPGTEGTEKTSSSDILFSKLILSLGVMLCNLQLYMEW